jgi:Rrf2 family transcriptional regulator, cysteine metabolism repressor
MKLSTKGRYAMRAILDLAENYNDGLVLVKDIAKRQKISERYLEHLFLSLKKAGLVKSVRGAHGGFTLAKPPDKINLIDIIRVSEGPLALVECVVNADVCPRSSQCTTRDVWIELQSAMDNVLGSMTLQDLIKRQQVKQQPSTNMYTI